MWLSIGETVRGVVALDAIAAATVGGRQERVQIRWRLRHVAADREIWTGAELRRLLLAKTGLSLTSSSMSALMATEPDKQPREVKVRTLAALCTVLNCTPNDLLEIDRTSTGDTDTAGNSTVSGEDSES
jgi:DNA-binding Xre family transcriptional regulator